MQQTEMYKLNLIESSDTFSPNPLNENMEKVEGALAAEASARTGETSALEQRVIALEGHKLATGIYVGTGDTDWRFFHLGFSPAFAIAQATNVPFMTVRESTSGPIRVDAAGFKVIGDLNSKGKTYQYLAIL